MAEANTLLSIDEPLARALELIHANLQRDTAPLQHVLIVAPRGGGKTTFLHALSNAIAVDSRLGKRVAVVTIGALEVGTAGPDHFIDQLAAALEGGMVQTTLDFGQFDEASWTAALGRLEKARTKPVRSRRRLGVLLVDAFDDALKRAFAPKDAQSRLRRLLQSDPGLMLIGAVNSSDVQRDYDERLFQSFLEIDLPEMTPKEIARLAGPKHGGTIAAVITEFIGGSPRRAQIMLNALKRESHLSAQAIIARLVAHEESGFDALLAGLPIRQRRVLDALLVGGEPNRPTALAELLGTTQADIADAVSMLASARIIRKSEASTTRRAYYIVADRLLAFWYANQRGCPAYLADLADIVTVNVVGQVGLQVAKLNRAAAFQAIETWLNEQSDKRQAVKVAAAALIRTSATNVLVDAADLITEIDGARSAAAGLLRATKDQLEAPTKPAHPDIVVALRLLRQASVIPTKGR